MGSVAVRPPDPEDMFTALFASFRRIPRSVCDEADERLVTAHDILAARAEFDQMMVRKGLLTRHRLELIRHGIRARAVVTAMRPTGQTLEDYREIELDVMVKKPEGGQFPVRETALVPASALPKVSPGSIIDTYYRSGDESAVAICVSPA
ncbi:hypothetical protein BST21_17470 [Mycolicibacterium celeriflavum]|nr:hypothetical protein BST21_17470 [Mycolicibacterium celeriflavum]